MDYPFRFGDPATSSPPTASGMAWNWPHLPARPSPGIKTHSSPAAFPATFSLPFFPLLFFFLHRPIRSYLRPHRAPITGPPFPQNRYDASSGKNAAARLAGSYSLDASATLSLRPSDTCVNPWAMTLVKRPAFASDFGHATALNANFVH